MRGVRLIERAERHGDAPAVSTRAESILHRSWGAAVIGMTALPEAKLAREAEICYSIIACATDYDAWHETEAAVSVDMILNTLKANIGLSKEIIRLAVTRLPATRGCACATALENAVVTPLKLVAPEQKKKLGRRIDKYI